jgi:hypothetical protein
MKFSNLCFLISQVWWAAYASEATALFLAVCWMVLAVVASLADKGAA